MGVAGRRVVGVGVLPGALRGRTARTGERGSKSRPPRGRRPRHQVPRAAHAGMLASHEAHHGEVARRDRRSATPRVAAARPHGVRADARGDRALPRGAGGSDRSTPACRRCRAKQPRGRLRTRRGDPVEGARGIAVLIDARPLSAYVDAGIARTTAAGSSTTTSSSTARPTRSPSPGPDRATRTTEHTSSRRTGPTCVSSSATCASTPTRNCWC